MKVSKLSVASILAAGMLSAISMHTYADSVVFASDRNARFQIYRQLLNPNFALMKELITSDFPEQITFSGSGAQESRSPEWTYDGRITYQFGASGVRGIHIVDLERFDQRLTFAPGDERDPSNSPDGKFIVYARKAPSPAVDYDLWLHNVSDFDDTFDYPLLARPTANEFRPAWSPNGQYIAFVTVISGRAQIAKVKVELDFLTGNYLPASGVTQLTTNTGTNFDPSWSPGSSQIAYSKQDATGVHIYRMSAEKGETEQVKLTANSAANRNPSWSPDGSLIAFTSERDSNREIYLISSEFGELGLSSSISSDREFGQHHFSRVTDNTATDDDAAWYRVATSVPSLPPLPAPAYKVLDVPYFSQNYSAAFAPWGANQYGGPSVSNTACGDPPPSAARQTIGWCGCLITSIAMILRYHGVNNFDYTPLGEPTSVDPGSINKFFSTPFCDDPSNPATCRARGYYPTGGLVWPAIENFAWTARSNFPEQPLIEISENPITSNLPPTIASEIEAGNPVLLRVAHPGQHWVVATGYFIDSLQSSSTQITLNDPAKRQNRTTLARQQTLQGTYIPNQVRTLSKTNSNLSSFYVWVSAPAHVLVIDPAGRRIGFDQATGGDVNEIPSAGAYMEQTLDTIDDVTGEVVPEVSVDSGYVVGIDDPIPGTYQVEVLAAAGQVYVLDTRGFDRNADSSAWVLRATVNAGERHIYTFGYSPELTTTTLTLNPVTDSTGDGVVNCNDIQKVRASFGKKYGNPGYDGRADVLTNGVVDVRDLAFVSQQLPVGVSCR